MPEIQIGTGNIIYEKGSPLTMIGLIVEGTIMLDLGNETVELTKGDVLGLLDLTANQHSCTYTATTDAVIEFYPYKSAESLHNIISGNIEEAISFVLSSVKQFFAITDLYNLNIYTCDSLYSALMEYHREYTKLCKQYHIPTKNLPGIENIHPLVLETKPATYTKAYYTDIQKMCKDTRLNALFEMPGFISGFLLGASHDMHQLLNTCDETETYQAQLSELLINDTHVDFLDLYTSILSHAAHKREDTTPLVTAISKIFIRGKNVSSISDSLYEQRLLSYRQLSAELEEMTLRHEEENPEHLKIAETKLKYSLSAILDFSHMPADFCSKFTADIDRYKKIADKTTVSSDLTQLRNDLTNSFFALYKAVFFMSVEKNSLPDVIKMFLYFGYVDEDLCGLEIAADLYSLLPSCRSDAEKNTYLFYDWLKLIYEGKKQPRCDEFDQDYPAYIQTLLQEGKISKEESVSLLNDTKNKVLYELEHMFSSAVKITYGRLQTYCPVLSEHDFIKNPEETLIIPSKLRDDFRTITNIDFSAYCREVMFADPILPNGRELIQKEILPDVILLPNIGTRAVLWQEIEGRNRSTPGCMVFPILCLTDTKLLAIRLTAEFRWEMCKRMQGSRWNDVSNLSLTSEYFDYLQFYKKNKELSTEAKEKCHQQLLRVKNRFRESFVLDYIAWITSESKGTPRMNKVTRRIFMTYCPFSSEYRDTLKRNPFYSDMIEKYENQKKKELTRINNVVYRIQRNGRSRVPSEITQQLEYLNK